MTAFIITNNTGRTQNTVCGWTLSKRVGTVTTLRLDSDRVSQLCHVDTHLSVLPPPCRPPANHILKSGSPPPELQVD